MGSQLDPKTDVLISHRDIRCDRKRKAGDTDYDGCEYVVSIFHKLNTDRDRLLFQRIENSLREILKSTPRMSEAMHRQHRHPACWKGRIGNYRRNHIRENMGSQLDTKGEVLIGYRDIRRDRKGKAGEHE